ncbi:MAG: extracellular solute-binding protein [Spirochaetia bacterium]|nr:extracellular solute-binding protein [Spirochaetia bacterium]
MSMNNFRAWKIPFIIAIVLLLLIIVISVAVYRNNTIVLELSLYSGNSWKVPQNFAYAIYDRAVEMFEERYAKKGFKIKLRTGTMYKDYSEMFAQLVLKGKESDLFLILEEDFNTYAAIGLLENLDSSIKKSSFNADSFFSNALEAGQYQGSQYSVPIGIVPSFLIVNNDLLDSLGLHIDIDNWDWNQFYSLCEAITQDLDGDGSPDRFGVEGYDWHHAFYTNDRALFNEQNTKAEFNDERMNELLLFLKDLHALNQGVLVRNGFFEKGKVGFKTFNLSEFRVYGSYPYKVLRYNQFNWDVLPFPQGPNGNSKSKLYTVQMGMSSRTRNKEAAFKFLEFISSDEAFQYEIWNYSNMLPVNRNVFELLYDSDVMQRDGLQFLDRNFIEDIIDHSYIDPNFKTYPVIDRDITQRIFTIIAQDEDIPRSIGELRDLINDSLNSTPYVRLTTH